MAKFKPIKGSVTTPLGYRAAACFCDVKTLGTGKGSNKGQYGKGQMSFGKGADKGKGKWGYKVS